MSLYNDALEQLDKDFPPPKQVLSLPEVCDVLDLKLKSIRNRLSEGKCPFPVLHIGGKVCVSKHAVASILAGIPADEIDDGKPKRRMGRPKNSDRLQRFAALSILAILDARMEAERNGLIEPYRNALGGYTRPSM